MIRKIAYILNIAIFATSGYVYGFHVGTNQPQVDRAAIDRAVLAAMMDQ